MALGRYNFGTLLGGILLSTLPFHSGATLMPETPTGNIAVYVVDAQGAILPGAKATATNEDTGGSGGCVTGEKDGSCVIAELPAALYKAEVTAPGFKTSIINGVRVEVSKTAKLAVTMQSGGVQETVEVTAEVVEELPLIGRNFTQYELLAPGVMANVSAPTSTIGAFSVNGGRPQSNGFFLAGASVKDHYSDTAVGSQDATNIARIIPIEAVGESSTLTSSEAEFGGYSGSIVNASPATAGNQLHGGVFEIVGNDFLNARDFFNFSGRKNKLRHNNFGGRLGGPLRRDKAFFFVAYEGQREALETTTIAAVPTPSDFDQAVSALGGDPLVPIVRNPVVNPIIRNLFSICQVTAKCPGGRQLWPSPSPGSAGNVLDAADPALTQRRSDSAFLSLTFRPDDKDNLEALYDFSDRYQSSPIGLDGSDPLPQTNTAARLHTHLGTFSYERMFSVNTLNRARVSWHRYSTGSLDQDAASIGDPSKSIGLNTGVANSRDLGLPQLRIRGLAFLGSSPYASPFGRIEGDWQLGEQFSWTHGPSILKFGYDFDRNSIRSFNDANYRGLLEFNSLADFLSGRVARGSISTGNSTRTTSQISHALFIQDNYRWSSKLTLNFGIRWEYFGVLHEDRALLSKYDASAGLVAPSSIYTPEFDNFSPRLGLSWQPASNTSLGATLAVFHQAPPQDVFIGQVQFDTFNPGIAYNPLSAEPILTSSSPSSIIQPGVPVFPAPTFATDTRDVTTVANIRVPYTTRYGADVQQQLFPGLAVQLAFVGSQGHRLFRVRDINAPAVPGGSRPLGAAAPLSTVAPNPPFIANRIETSAASNFNSLQFTLKQPRPWRGWQNYAFWTWSHSIDNASAGLDWIPNMSLPNNSRSPDLERASSSFDQRHNFLFQSVYDFPSSSKKLFLDGWQISGSLTLKSGQPYNINFADEFDTQGAYDFILRPDVVGNPSLGTSAPNRLLNLAVFAVPCTLDGLGTTVSHCIPGTLHYGNLSRNAFVGPNFGEGDLAISKNFRIGSGERFRLRVRAEAFNVTNHPNFATPVFPRYIALASLKGISVDGRGGAAGANCSTLTASVDCYLPATATPAGVNKSTQGGGPRSLLLSAKFSF